MNKVEPQALSKSMGQTKRSSNRKPYNDTGTLQETRKILNKQS